MKFYNKILMVLSFALLMISCTPKEQPVTPAEALAMGKKIEKEISSGKSIILDNFFDENVFSNKILAYTTGYKQTYIKAQLKDFKLGSEILKSKGKDGIYRLVKVYEKAGKQHLIFSFYLNKSGLNYYDYELVKFNDQIKAADAYTYLTGEWLSKTLADNLMNFSNSKSNSVTDQTLKRLNNLVRLRQYDEAMELYNTIPKDIQKGKVMQIMHLRISDGLGGSSFTKALEEYKELFPNEPNMYLLVLEKYFYDRDFPKVLETVNSLDSVINKDPFLDYYRGLAYNSMNNKVDAIAAYERLKVNMPDFNAGLYQLILTYAEDKDFDKAKKVLTQYIHNPPPDKEAELITLYSVYPQLRDHAE